MMLRIQRFWLQITADRKRFGILCGVLLIGLLLWSRLIVVSNLPRTAIAEDEDGGSSHRVDRATGSDSGATASDGLSAAAPPAQKQAGPDNTNSPPIAVALHHVPNHDPFQINPDIFPRMIENIGQDGEKSHPNPADNPLEAEARRTEQLRTMVNQLTLEAVLKQEVPLVVINARTYRQGDDVPAPKNESIRFRLSEVKHRSVVLEYEGRMFELKMTSPPGLSED